VVVVAAVVVVVVVVAVVVVAAGLLLAVVVVLFDERSIFKMWEYRYHNSLQNSNLLTFPNRRRQFDALFLTNGPRATKCCPSPFSPSARCASTANALCNCTHVSSNSCLSVNYLN
jgi:hypothetical protein